MAAAHDATAANLLGAFYTLYLRQAGHYLIELNSGRLRGGWALRAVIGRIGGDQPVGRRADDNAARHQRP